MPRPVPTLTEARAAFERAMQTTEPARAAQLRNYMLALTQPRR